MIIDNLDNLIEFFYNSQITASGSNSRVILYNDNLIKFDKLLYDWLNVDNLTDLKLFKLLTSSFYEEIFRPSTSLIDYYNSVKDKVKLTKLPQELLYYKKSPLGIILPYHKDYTDLLEFEKFDKKELYIIIKKILESLHELEDNGIYQLDLNYGKNILYDEMDIQIIDLDGPYIKIGDDQYASLMYEQFILVVLNLLNMCDDNNVKSFKTDIIKERVSNYENSNRVVKELRKVL